METIHKLLGAFQILGGVFSLITLWSPMSNRDIGASVALVLFSALAICAGVSMWREQSVRWQLTIANQLTQLVAVYSPLVSFGVVHVASIPISSHWYAAATFADSTFRLGAVFLPGASVCDLLWNRSVAGLPSYGVSLNLLALGILLYSGRARERANRLPEHTSGLRPDPIHL